MPLGRFYAPESPAVHNTFGTIPASARADRRARRAYGAARGSSTTGDLRPQYLWLSVVLEDGSKPQSSSAAPRSGSIQRSRRPATISRWLTRPLESRARAGRFEEGGNAAEASFNLGIVLHGGRNYRQRRPRSTPPAEPSRLSTSRANAPARLEGCRAPRRKPVPNPLVDGDAK